MDEKSFALKKGDPLPECDRVLRIVENVVYDPIYYGKPEKGIIPPKFVPRSKHIKMSPPAKFILFSFREGSITAGMSVKTSCLNLVFQGVSMCRNVS